MTNLETYGDLKKLINIIKLKQKGQKIISKGKEFALDQVLGLIPGASNAKTAFDFLKTAISKPDTKKTNTWLDKLDIDDKMSAIVDDTVESGFMQAMADTIQNEPDDKSLEDDFNMNQKMVDYLRDKYEQRTITGIKENMKTQQQLRKLIREIILSEIQTPSDVVNLTKIIKSNTSLINALQKVDQPSEVLSFMEYILSTINPKITGVNTSALKTAIDNRFTKKI